MLKLAVIPALCWMAVNPLKAGVIISEFLAENTNGIQDENSSHQDWIELYNSGSDPIRLDGWWITDDASRPAKWLFPNVSIPSGGTLFLWASGKDRRIVGQPLHTNFSLSKSGEYLGLYRPDETTGKPTVVDQFTSTFPVQAADISYGRTFSAGTTTILPSASTGKFKIAASAAQYSGTNYASGDLGNGATNGWNRSLNFNDSTWTTCTTGVGYDANGLISPLIGTDVQSVMRSLNPSILIRIKFNVSNPSAYDYFKLRIKYEDGCAAFLNGGASPVASYAAATVLNYNSTATANASSSTWQNWSETTLPVSSILAGENLLAIQGLNTSISSSDFLALPEIIGFSTPVVGPNGYFSTPTPGVGNGTSTSGPVIYGASPADPNIPRPGGTSSSPPLTVSLKVIQTQYAISSVRVIPRVMFNSELSAITLLDNGIAPDLVPGDKIFTANIPTASLTYGQMLRWRFEVSDSGGTISKLPAYLSTMDSPQYFGTVALRNDLAYTRLPAFDWFVANAPTTGPTAAAFRGSLYFLNYFYDNIGHEIHGQSTAGMAKKSYDFDSNTGFRFLWQEGEKRVKDLNLLSNFADKTKTRNTLSQEVVRLMDAPYHFCYPVRMHLNGALHGVMDMMEDGDDRMLERNGLDPEGAFYKIYSETMNSSPEKKTRQTEPNTDLNTLTNSLDPSVALSTRRTYAYDNINIPAAINYLVTRQLNSDSDHGHKNYYLFRDTNGTGEWMPIVWDVDLTQGHQWNGNNGTGGYFNDTLVTSNSLNSHTTNNRLYNVLLEPTEFQEMFACRMRSAMDTILQAPGTINGYFETRMRAIAASIDPDPSNPSPLTDGDLDRAKWGMSSTYIDNRPREEVERVISSYFGPRRTFMFEQGTTRPLVQKPYLSGGTPLPNQQQSAAVGSVKIDSADFLPTGETQNAEYIILKNTTSAALDLTGWTLDGGVDHKFPGGTVIPAGSGTAVSEYKGLLHVAKDAFAFRSRTSGPTGGQKRLVQGNYVGQLSARGETVNLRNSAGLIISTFSYLGTPTLSQQYLRISEIQYHPAAPTAVESATIPGVTDEDFTYIELMNIGASSLDLTGTTFSQGITYTFRSGSLAAGARIILAKNPEAFALRYPSTQVPVVGPYEGDLDNGGERLELTDAVGENILDFEYKDGWYPVTDGSGRSLVLREPTTTPFRDFGNPVVWAISGGGLGDPGIPEKSFAQAYHGWDNFSFTELERDDPTISGMAADPDGDGRDNREEYAFGTDPRTADSPLLEFVWVTEGVTRRPGLRVKRPTAALDVTYELLAAENLTDWSAVPHNLSKTVVRSNQVEEVIFSETSDLPGSSRFLSLRYTVTPQAP